MGIFLVVAGIMFLWILLGIVFFIYGLVKKRTWLWVSGIVLVLLGIGIKLTLSSICIDCLRGSPPHENGTFSSKETLTDKTMREWFTRVSDIQLPEEVKLIDGEQQFVMIEQYCSMKLSVPQSFNDLLKEKCGETTWEDCKSDFEKDLPYWNMGEIKSSRFFVNFHNGITRIAFNKGKQIAYVVGHVTWDRPPSSQEPEDENPGGVPE